MVLVNLKENRKYTYQDYLTWPDEERWEIIDGKAYNMSPAPVPEHQSISVNLTLSIGNALVGKPCKLFTAPCDVVLSDDTVVQPDLFVICDSKKKTLKNIQGAPDLVIEILSPSTSQKDQDIKKDLYARHKVKEYIIVDPDSRSVFRYVLVESGKFSPVEIYDATADVPLVSLPGLAIPLKMIFETEG